jgi:hypothetical protein
LDGKKIAETADRELPQFVYTFDSEQYYFLDFQPEGNLLEINARWPYEHSAHPVLFGRAYSHLPLTECLSSGFDLLRTEEPHGQSCSVVSFNFESGKVVSWIARNPPMLALREEFHNSDGIVLAREFEFESTTTGFKYPKRGTEVRTNIRGTVTTVWTTITFEIDPVLPSYVFKPSLEDASVVIDRATGETLKGKKETS